MNNIDTKKYLSIQMAAEFAGLSAHTIRAWEKRYNALTPLRSENGNRLYTEVEAERLKTLAQLVNLGSSISQIANLSDAELSETFHKLTHAKDRYTAASPSFDDVNSDEVLKEILNHIEIYEMGLISETLSKTRTILEPRKLAFEILSPLLEKLEAKKSTGDLKLAQVQAMLALIKFHTGIIIYSNVERQIAANKKYILTSIEDSHFSFSLTLTALLCCHYRKRFFYLNSNLPGESMVEAFKATESQIMILNILDTNDIDLVKRTLDTFPENMEVWIVGESHYSSLAKSKSMTMFKNLSELDAQLERIS